MNGALTNNAAVAPKDGPKVIYCDSPGRVEQGSCLNSLRQGSNLSHDS